MRGTPNPPTFWKAGADYVVVHFDIPKKNGQGPRFFTISVNIEQGLQSEAS